MLVVRSATGCLPVLGRQEEGSHPFPHCWGQGMWMSLLPLLQYFDCLSPAVAFLVQPPAWLLFSSQRQEV